MSFAPAATRRIGKRDVDVSLLGVGTAPFGSTAREDSDESIAEAFSRLYDAETIERCRVKVAQA